MLKNDEITKTNGLVQFSTFTISGRLYGIEVMSVQEVTMPMPLTPVPLTSNFVKGLINLRGQISTAIDMRGLFGLEKCDTDEKMAVVCRSDDSLISLLIDQIGDVIEADIDHFEKAPDTVSSDIRKYIKGVHKLENNLMTVIDVKKIFNLLNQKVEAA